MPWRSRFVTVAWDSDAGRLASSWPFSTCPTMTASGQPAWTSDRNGASSTGCHVRVTSTNPASVLPVELPIPGKCLIAQRTPTW